MIRMMMMMMTKTTTTTSIILCWWLLLLLLLFQMVNGDNDNTDYQVSSNREDTGSSYYSIVEEMQSQSQSPPLQQQQQQQLLFFHHNEKQNDISYYCSWIAWMILKGFFLMLFLGMIVGGGGDRKRRRSSPTTPPAAYPSWTNSNGGGSVGPKTLRRNNNNYNNNHKTTKNSSSGTFYYVPSIVTLFISSHGWSHRITGGAHLIWLVLGTFVWTTDDDDNGRITAENTTHQTTTKYNDYYFQYDMILGILGIIATITAAYEFPHKLIQNANGQSGTLHSNAIVTQSEMIEHAFYQGLNLCQAMYLHAMAYTSSLSLESSVLSSLSTSTVSSTLSAWIHNHNHHMMLLFRLGLLWIVTAPWLVRHHLPVHSFSHNWNIYQMVRKQKQQEQQQKKERLSIHHHPDNKNNNNNDTIEILLYRIKKAQYLFYKHVILHGMNISIFLTTTIMTTTTTTTTDSNNTDQSCHYTMSSSPTCPSPSIPYSFSWRIFWLLLNTSYVMEFFLQTLVKRSILSQWIMLWFQRWLMIGASIGAMSVLWQYDIYTGWMVCLLSLLFNFIHRYHDVMNTITIAIVSSMILLITGVSDTKLN